MQAQIHAPRTGYAYNLLDNSDFRNPINQRGASTYSGDFTYSIDRWQLGNGGAQIYVISDGLKISNATGAGDYIFQRLERLPPGNYTFAAKFRDNTGAAALTNYSIDQGVTLAPTSYADSGVLVLTVSNGEDLDSTFAYYRLQNTTPGAVCTWEWAALYEGEYTADTLPPYQPKGYGAELAECRRYFIRTTGNAIFVGAGSEDTSTVRCYIPTGGPMRMTVPSVSPASGLSVSVRVHTGVYNATDATAAVASTDSNGVLLRLTSANQIINGQYALAAVCINTPLSISADL